MSRHRKKSGVPDRWLDYRAVGQRLSGTRFIAFKVPLKQSLNCQLPRSEVFGPWELLDALRRDNQELGLIIDLTFTTRYYKLQDVPDSLLLVKILTAGHQVPGDDTILSFKRAVRRFLRENADNDKLIGVHCTHGLNRTGYLICRYLIDVDGMDPRDAVQLFNSARGHAVERQNYLDDLWSGRKRSNEGMDESEQEPIRGLATHRPSYPTSDSDSREEGRPLFNESRQQRYFPPRGTNQRSHPRHSHSGLLPTPPPPLRPVPVGPTFNPDRWTPPHPEYQWRPPRSEERRSRYSPLEPDRRSSSRLQEDRRRAPPLLPRYSARWTNESNESNGYDRRDEEWGCPQRRHHFSVLFRGR